MVKRCEGCDEPEFMCCCSKEFVGKIITEVYHRGVFVDRKQLDNQVKVLKASRPERTIVLGQNSYKLAAV